MKALLIIALCITGTFAQHNYNYVLDLSIRFYEAQRSGDLPDSNRIKWRGDSAMGDKGHNGEDLTGGWYDAGDHVKFGFPMAWATTTILWGIIDFERGYRSAGQYDNALDSVKWTLDYFLKCYVEDRKFYGQVANGHEDHKYWGRPEQMTMARPAYAITADKPGSDLAGETAAALAAGSIAFRNKDSAYADRLLDAAKRLYAFAYSEPRGKYSDSIPDAKSFYGSTGYNDELSWGGIWLYRATGDQDYLNKAKEFYDGGLPWAYSWDSKFPGVQVMFYRMTNDTKYADDVKGFMKSWLPGGSVPYTPRGLAWRNEWGSLRYSANTCFIAMQAAELGIMQSEYISWAAGQLQYMMGNAMRSFVVGYGHNPPVKPHHRAASCNDFPAVCNDNDRVKADPNPQVLHGALVGGPNQNDEYVDDRNDFRRNEVATDYNAGFQGALAGMLSMSM